MGLLWPGKPEGEDATAGKRIDFSHCNGPPRASRHPYDENWCATSGATPNYSEMDWRELAAARPARQMHPTPDQ